PHALRARAAAGRWRLRECGSRMLTHELLNDESILILRPQDAPEAAVSGNALLSVGARIASHFVAAETRDFPWAVRDLAGAWVRGGGQGGS
ncbi:MAG TPA: hypothetical protein VFP70_04125, partial [Burkholderiales bacterium]|nr:hypothetical protein [Burkholderiales bacterium]